MAAVLEGEHILTQTDVQVLGKVELELAFRFLVGCRLKVEDPATTFGWV
jgi:hypothetical protein